MAQNGKATTTKKTFSRQTVVSIDINAEPAIIWQLLTNASDMPRWNSTITSLEGEIKLGNKIRLMSYLDEKRVFKLKIREFDPEKKMAWGDGMGTRYFILSPNKDGSLKFTMDEKIGGVMFPLFAKMIPDFDESFEKFAADLKAEAERISKVNN